jgi:hypothetical protein
MLLNLLKNGAAKDTNKIILKERKPVVFPWKLQFSAGPGSAPKSKTNPPSTLLINWEDSYL